MRPKMLATSEDCALRTTELGMVAEKSTFGTFVYSSISALNEVVKA
jgi:hypothetical protein